MNGPGLSNAPSITAMLAPGGRARGPAIQLSSAGVSLRTLSPRPVIGCAVCASCARAPDPVIELTVIMKMATAALGKNVFMCRPPWVFDLRRVPEAGEVRNADELSTEADHSCTGEALQAPRDMDANRAEKGRDLLLAQALSPQTHVLAIAHALHEGHLVEQFRQARGHTLQ